MDDLRGREIFFELMTLGAYVKVMAIDVATHTEISIQGPKGTSEDILKRNAVQRLAYVLRKKGLIG